MNRMALAALAALAVTQAVPAARASDAQGVFAVEGIATETCAMFIQERDLKSERYFMFGGWVDGYVTAINQYNVDTYDITTWETTDLLMALIDRHCRANPDDEFVGVVAAMAKKLNPDRLKAQSPVIDIVVGDKKGKMYQEVLRRVQQALIDQGFYQGTADGQFGPQTQQAIAAFQTARQLESSGFPDQITMLALLRPGP
jgi:hypothetical protein